MPNENHLKLLSDVENAVTWGYPARFHLRGKTFHHQQSVAEHSWGAAMILNLLWPNAPAHMIWAVLKHDVSEAATGDVPSPVKQHNPELARSLTNIERAFNIAYGVETPRNQFETDLLDFVDRAEGVMFCSREVLMGNRLAKGSLAAYMRHANSAANKMHAALNLGRYMGEPHDPEVVNACKTLAAEFQETFLSIM